VYPAIHLSPKCCALLGHWKGRLDRAKNHTHLMISILLNFSHGHSCQTSTAPQVNLHGRGAVHRVRYAYSDAAAHRIITGLALYRLACNQFCLLKSWSPAHIELSPPLTHLSNPELPSSTKSNHFSTSKLPVVLSPYPATFSTVS
jgi:hypothetical protein